MRELSKVIDISRLDGVSIAVDYAEALANLDRGFEASHPLTPSDGLVIGVAMTPAVLREDVVKSHIVLNASYVHMLGDYEDEFWPTAFHLLAHECAHVEINAAWDTSFPGEMLRTHYDNLVDGFLGQIVSACWDEYAACRISAGMGADPLEGYIETLENSLAQARSTANGHLRLYRTHGDHGRVLGEVFGEYGNLMKYASYLLGHMDGMGLSIDDVLALRTLLEDSWFEPFFHRLRDTLNDIFETFGRWTDKRQFDDLEALVVELMADGGIELYWTGDGGAGFNAPFTADTMPSLLGPLLDRFGGFGA
jgi:hypothetical protein